MNTMEKIRDSRKGKRNPCSTWRLGAEEAETVDRLEGVQTVRKFSSVCFPVTVSLFEAFVGHEKSVLDS